VLVTGVVDGVLDAAEDGSATLEGERLGEVEGSGELEGVGEVLDAGL